MELFGISLGELLVLLGLALILFGPEKLPEYGEKLGRMIAKVRQAGTEVTRSLQSSLHYQPPPPVPGAACPRCQHNLEPNFDFCPHCGHRLKEAPGFGQTKSSPEPGP